MKTNETAKEALAPVEVEINPSVFNTLSFERDIPEWSYISMALNLLLFHSMRSLGDDNSLSDDHNVDCMQSLMSLKQEIDRSVQYSLSYIPK